MARDGRRSTATAGEQSRDHRARLAAAQPRATSAVSSPAARIASGRVVALRVALRVMLALLLAPGLPLLAVPLPGRTHVQRRYCRLMLRCFGVRITVSGNPIRNLRGVLVVSGHISWLDVFAIGAVMPGSVRRPCRHVHRARERDRWPAC